MIQAHYEKIAQQLPDYAQPWLKALRQQAVERFNETGFPTTRQEDWKYTKVTPIAENQFNVLPTTIAQENIMLPAQITDDVAARLVFVDGQYNQSLSISNDSFEISSLAEILNKKPELVADYLGCLANSDDTGFSTLNSALLHEGFVIHIPDGVVIEKPIISLFVTTELAEQRALNFRNLILAGKNSQATLLEHYVNVSTSRYFTNIITEAFLQENAHFTHVKLQQESEQAFHIGHLFVEQQRDSQFASHSCSLGGLLVRSDTSINLISENAHADLYGLFLGDKKQHIDHHTRVNHLQSHTYSQESYKGILVDQARGVFNGQVIVHPKVKKIQALQQNKNLLLSKLAEIDTKPQLEIYADDVQCTHGATVGHLDQQALFALQARGIDKELAKSILQYAFAQEILQKLPASLAEQIQDTVMDYLPASEQLKELMR